MAAMNARTCVLMAAFALLWPSLGWAQAENTLGTIGAGVPNQSSVPGPRWTPPSGPAPRLASGKPDLSGVWDHPYVPDMSATNKANPTLQTGAGEVPYSEAGLSNLKAYDPEHNGCLLY